MIFMSKINIDLKLTSSNEVINKKISGIFNNNRIIYIDDNIKTTIILDEILTLKRESKEYIINLIFDNNKSSEYILVDHNIKIPLNLKIVEIIRKNNYLKLKYQLDVQEENSIYELELNYKKI